MCFNPVLCSCSSICGLQRMGDTGSPGPAPSVSMHPCPSALVCSYLALQADSELYQSLSAKFQTQGLRRTCPSEAGLDVRNALTLWCLSSCLRSTRTCHVCHGRRRVGSELRASLPRRWRHLFHTSLHVVQQKASGIGDGSIFINIAMLISGTVEPSEVPMSILCEWACSFQLMTEPASGTSQGFLLLLFLLLPLHPQRVSFQRWAPGMRTRAESLPLQEGPGSLQAG